jgi:hypothetical protein
MTSRPSAYRAEAAVNRCVTIFMSKETCRAVKIAQM